MEKFYFTKISDGSNLVDEFEYREIENLILEDLEEIFVNYTILNKYTRTMLITLKLVLQSGYDPETSDSMYNMLMSTFLIFGGWIYSTYVLILISNVMMAWANSESKFEEMSREISAFCESKKLSRMLTDKIHMMFKHKLQKHYFNEDAIQQSTPANLRREIMMHSCSHLVSAVPMFQLIPRVLLENIISCLKLEIFFPDDVIIKAGATGDAMYFIAFGTAGIYSTAGEF